MMMASFSGVATAEEETDAAAALAEQMIGESSGDWLTSEFVQYVFQEAKSKSIPRYAHEQQQVGEPVEKQALKAGDVVFFQGTGLMSGIYLGEGNFVIVTSEGISLRNLHSSAYWENAYTGAVRFDHDITDEAATLAIALLGENVQNWITSEFVQHVYAESKQISLPRSAVQQWIEGEAVSEPEPGDAVFFQGSYLMSGIYIGHGRFVIVTSEGISERNMETSSYWGERYIGARHFESTEPPVSTDDEIVELARELIGTPYNRSGTNPNEGFHSGSFVFYVFKEITGSWLSMRTAALFETGDSVQRDELEPGDLVFFENDEQELIVGIYAENDQFVIATSSGVEERHMEYNRYYEERYVGAVRYTGELLEKAHPSTYENADHPVVRESMKYLGTPYLMTGSTLDAFDCSFLVQMLFRDAMDIYLPRISYKQWEVGETMIPEGADIEAIDLDDELQPGDVLYFSGTWQSDISHTAVYLGDDYIVHATGEEGQTTISHMTQYWRDHFTGAKRFDDLTISFENDIVYEAFQQVGLDYLAGGSSPDEGFDTGGLVQYVFKKAWDYNMPRFGRLQMEQGTPIGDADAQPGDVLFFQGSSIIPAIYIGNNQMIVATVANGVTVIDLTTSDYWPPRFIGANTYTHQTEENGAARVAEGLIGQSFNDTSLSFIVHIYEQGEDVQLPTSWDELRDFGDDVHIEELQVGNLIFFDDPTIVGIYIGDGKFITIVNEQVSVQSLNGDFRWLDRFSSATSIE
ncbi:NLP/P60 family protein [Geomicrobium sp. JCM 19039]|nr:NLP/P60 family protein [Geomicrobium sp. JCM 19039]